MSTPNHVELTLEQVLELGGLALRQGTHKAWMALAAAWMKAAVDEVQKLRIQRGNLQAQLDELLFAVVRKFPNESRHETALRYIRETEAGDSSVEQSATSKEQS